MLQVVDRHLQQHVQLVLGDHHPQPVAGVHDEHDALAVPDISDISVLIYIL